MTSSATRTTVYLCRSVVGEDGEAGLDSRDVLRRRVDQEVDVLGSAPAAVGDDRETSDQDVAGLGFVESAADASDVFERRRTYVRAVIRVIHSSASSKLRNR